jgi:tRNA 2-selenouridine synthase SelU
VGKHYNNPQCFKEKNYEAKSMKFTVIILNQLNIKNNKIDKDNFEKNHKKKSCRVTM